MSDATLSPEKGKPPPKSTYANRMKTKREGKQKAQSLSDAESAHEVDDEKETEEVKEKEKGDIAKQATSPPASKRPEPERTFAIPDTPARASQKSSSTAFKVPASTSTLGRKNSILSLKEDTPAHESPEPAESVSDAESAVDGKQRRKRKSEAERIQFFRDDPWCKEVEPHRILCSQCGEWQDLHPKRRYVMQAWVTHRKTCSGAKKSPSPVTAKPLSQASVASTPQTKATPFKTQTPKVQTPGGTAGDTLGPMEAEGKATLENDFRAGEIRPHEVFCTQCATWVKLYPTTKYSPRNWLTHVQQCPAAPMPLANTVSADAAPSSIPEDAPSAAIIPSTPAISEETRVDPEVSPSLNRKRRRDDTETDIEASPAVRRIRPRTETYKPPLGRALWNMVTKPIASFIQGFKHGLKSDSHAEKLEPAVRPPSEDPSSSNAQ